MAQQSNYTAPNTGGIKRGDSAETGDLEAQPTSDFEIPEELDDLGGMTILEADDPTLGLTNLGEVPADDWAADTGPTHTAEGDHPIHKR